MQNTKLSQSIVRQTNDDNNNDNEVYSYVDSMTPLWKKYPDIHGYFVANFPHFNVTGSVKMYMENSSQDIRGYTDIFYSVCGLARLCW